MMFAMKLNPLHVLRQVTERDENWCVLRVVIDRHTMSAEQFAADSLSRA